MDIILLHAPHAVLAGVWLGGVVFTTFVVSPALKSMKWAEPQRVLVRSVIGKYYARLAIANLTLLLVFAVLDGWASGFGMLLYTEYVLLVALFGLVGAHGAYFGRNLASLAEAEQKADDPEVAASYAVRRRSLQKVSARVS